jgi:lipopolysaccharide transport system permease protein
MPEPQLLLMPVVGLLCLLTALGFGLWFSAINVKYRDVHLAIPFALLVGLFITPIVYPFDLVPANLQPLYALNPMVGVLEVYRWSLLGTDFPGMLVLIPVAMSMVALVSGAVYFNRAEQRFADVI